MRKLWRLPYITHCNLLHTILSIQISLEKRGIKSIWSCLNSENCVVKTISQLATKLTRSVLVIITDIFHINIRSCHTSGTSHITLFIIP